jgi:hypothetical protein
MKTYCFKLVLAGITEVTDEQGELLYEAGCDDGLIVSRDGVAFIRFSRESRNLEEAINSAAADVENAGLHVDHVEVECPV